MDEHATERDWQEALPGLIGAVLVLALLALTIVSLVLVAWLH